ncbi:uncharacterized protein PAC_20051 [Phialocephala subalpina]|uniref:Uncharacterized protein n=1 Tax=Phialocephala subalpina TaxID=576137 RepID=A0A1L7XYV9_9HELO|nr:uncharacterized protein PAC_20051 [Phialocephala subalpina]
MARKRSSTASSGRDRSPSRFLVTFRSIVSPIVRFCTVSTDTLDTFVALCAGSNSITRIERARSTKLINKLSQALDPAHSGNGNGSWADAVGGSYTGIRDAVPSLVTPWNDRHLGVVYRYRLKESPDEPVYKPPRGSGCLGLQFGYSSASRAASPHHSRSTSRSDSPSKFTIDDILEAHSAGRTNLSFLWRRNHIANAIHNHAPPPEPYLGRPPCPKRFPFNRKKSTLSNIFAPEPEEEEAKEEEGQWVDVTEASANEGSTKGSPARGTQTKGSPTRQIRGRRPVKFAAGKGKDSGRMAVPAQDSKVAGKEVKKVYETKDTATDDCAIGSDDEEWDPDWVIQKQQQRKRYNS